MGVIVLGTTFSLISQAQCGSHAFIIVKSLPPITNKESTVLVLCRQFSSFDRSFMMTRICLNRPAPPFTLILTQHELSHLQTSRRQSCKAEDCLPRNILDQHINHT
ncbi:hypothetical protein EJ05DRAFT_220975 [Pseudovirgaria hyperparasitica]|uniref:Uncharacterized protein n=1 Tax=Pseudovirgaria hyperparasitica TaxID=470096 RepID=A0A6A6VWB6_9PEZI|nr:uncharacterized protein EJ05DRAFT_220975 [Pseudovirgaria hyperparasitica]KAF2753531.1 hypothetical protein EJ05DRAFT_220975 [Pseudovirgaria hyperparasitica]